MLRNCLNCGKLHTQPTELCEECREREKKLYKKVNNYLWDNPNSSVDQIHEDTGVPREKIVQFVREGRFAVTNGTIDVESEKN
ncbi:MAG: hypothetical protein ACOC4G_03650 [Bacillota bacterium]